jgi:hypothetical protein
MMARASAGLCRLVAAPVALTAGRSMLATGIAVQAAERTPAAQALHKRDAVLAQVSCAIWVACVDQCCGELTWATLLFTAVA